MKADLILPISEEEFEALLSMQELIEGSDKLLAWSEHPLPPEPVPDGFRVDYPRFPTDDIKS